LISSTTPNAATGEEQNSIFNFRAILWPVFSICLECEAKVLRGDIAVLVHRPLMSMYHPYICLVSHLPTWRFVGRDINVLILERVARRDTEGSCMNTGAKVGERLSVCVEGDSSPPEWSIGTFNSGSNCIF